MALAGAGQAWQAEHTNGLSALGGCVLVLAIVGPTACGKSAVALQLAERCGGEIISCDSVQVYRGFVIGCAKPSEVERRRVPHHLLDVAEWNESFDAARYSRLARAAISDIHARHRLAIVCGGTGLYLRALRFGLVPMPPADAALRRRLEAQVAADPVAARARLAEVDPETAGGIHPNNRVRLVRALEIWELTGEPPSRLRRRHGFAREQVPMTVVALRRSDADLRRRIEVRTQVMLQAGLVQEVAALLAAGVAPTARPMQSVGYREACAVVRGEASRRGLAERISKSTWAYARRQRTWLRRERQVQWRDVAADERPAQTATGIERAVGGRAPAGD